MSTKKNPRGKTAPKPASAKASPMKAGAARVRRPAAKTAARPANAASSARPAAPPNAPGPAREATPIASESLLTLITANLAALREQITAGGGKRAHAATAKDNKNLVEAVKRLEASCCKLLRRS